MGHRKYNVKLSIKGQVIAAFALILICSLLMTIATYFGIGAVAHHFTKTPAGSDVPEEEIARVQQYITSEGSAVLHSSEQPRFQALLRSKDVKYIVVDSQARPIYGTMDRNRALSKQDLFQNMNVSISNHQASNPTQTKVIPVLQKDGALAGAVEIQWHTSSSASFWSNPWHDVLTFTLLFIPFLYMLLFTYLFARRVGKNLNGPLQALIESTRRIQHRDLDFTIDYQGSNEIGKVLEAFEDMRKDLKESLLAQWELEEERREMLAAVSHDLRTPITIIRGHVENLLETPSQSTERLHRYLNTIARNTNRVVRLMDDFQTVTEIDSPELSLHPLEVDVAEYTDAAFHEFLVVTRSHGIALSLDYKDERSQKKALFIDTDRISQVIDNLMANAIRYTPEGGEILWKVNVREEVLQISIADTGQGFPTHERGRLFHKFYQADKSRSVDHGSSGLGLYIVKTLVEKHGGSVVAENNTRGGATFTFHVSSLG